MIVLSAFFSSAETSMMTINRYRLLHMAKDKHRGAILVSRLLSQPDRLLGLILFGNNLVNISAASVATVITLKLVGEEGILPASLVLTGVILVFGEVAPKTVAALHPERIAFPFAYILQPLSYLLYPFVWVINKLANGLLRLFGINTGAPSGDGSLTIDELRTVVREAGNMIPMRHRRMLISILDLENVTVEDIMVHRSEIVGIDIDDPPAEIIGLLRDSQHTRLPVYQENIDNIIGMLHVRHILRVLSDKDIFTIEDLKRVTVEPYFVPLNTQLHIQLRNFQKQKIRVGLVVDEYGSVQGLVTMEDILEEIVGEFTTDLQTYDQDIHPQEDGSFIIDGAATLRDINKQLKWELPTDGAKTLNGLILEYMERIPDPGTSLRIGNFAMEVTQAADNAVKTVRITPLRKNDSRDTETA
ncbi:MAG: magnesium/cobalt efflux protein [Gammaproteobacteria bacterium RIFCSPLOWO2_02_FULL_56_15]|nr:MAG: magnesium/cobalt efflux protein [Gammaproteobacteria bacterium RIFCSPLOWO2_02_FULL_56_15]